MWLVCAAMSASAEEVHLSACLNGWTGAELEFFAEEEMVAVKPNFSQDVIPLLGATDARTVGPFRPPLPAMVPLWMAVQLKKQRRGELVCPPWLTVQSLDAWLEEERTQDSFSTPPIVAYAEVARVLLHYARDDLGADAPAIEERLGDIRDVRAAKIKKGLNLLNDDIGTYIKVRDERAACWQQQSAHAAIWALKLAPGVLSSHYACRCCCF